MNAIRQRRGAISAAAALAAGMLLAAGQAGAQQVCLVHDEVTRQLAKQFDENITARGLSHDGKAMFEIFSSEAGTWTLIVTDVNGRSCVIASGDAWYTIKAPSAPAS